MTEVLLFRSGRHLDAALQALRRQYPDCRVTIVAQPGVERLGLPPEQTIVYADTPFFAPRAFRRSEAGRRVRAGRFNRVAVLWGTPDGAGFENVSRTALAVSPRGFLAITPDGTIVPCPLASIAAREASRAAASIVAAIVIGVFLLLPARVLRFLQSCPAVVGRGFSLVIQ